MIRYNNEIINIKDKRLNIISLNSSQSHFKLKRKWHKDVVLWPNHWRFQEEATLQNTDNIKSTITTKFKNNPKGLSQPIATNIYGHFSSSMLEGASNPSC